MRIPLPSPHRSLVSLVSVGLLAGLAGCGGDRICTAQACGRTPLRLTVPWSLLESRRGEVRVCINDRCSAAPIWRAPAGPDDLGQWVGPFSGPIPAAGGLTTLPTPFGAEPRYDLLVYVALPDEVADGDRYEIRLTDPQSGGAAVQAWSATYYDTRPNGPGCEPVCPTPSLRAL